MPAPITADDSQLTSATTRLRSRDIVEHSPFDGNFRSRVHAFALVRVVRATNICVYMHNKRISRQCVARGVAK